MIELENKIAGGLTIVKATRNFDPLKDSQIYWLCMCSLVGSDGKKDHAVAIANGWIFDSTFEKAMQLNKKNLDLCCSSDEAENTFCGINIGWLVRRDPRKKKRRRCRGQHKTTQYEVNKGI
jgi:hypothetical protein